MGNRALCIVGERYIACQETVSCIQGGGLKSSLSMSIIELHFVEIRALFEKQKWTVKEDTRLHLFFRRANARQEILRRCD